MEFSWAEKRRAFLQFATVLVFLLFVLTAAQPAEAGAAPPAASGRSVVLFPYAPIPVAHLWRYESETVEDCVRPALERALSLFEALPSFRFSLGGVPLLEPIMNRHADLWKKVGEAVKAGRLGPTGAAFSQFLGLGPCGEALVRQFVLGKAFWKEALGLEPKTFWAVRASGLPAALPDILAGSGIKVCFLGSRAPYPVFFWEGPGGGRVLAVRLAEAVTADAVADLFSSKQGPDLVAAALPTSEHGGGLSEEMLKKLVGDLASRGFKVRFAGAGDVLKLFAQEKGLPVFRGRFDSATPGESTTLGKIKNANRTAENLLLVAERFAAVASRYGPPLDGPLADAWHALLLSQERHILGGKVVPPAAEDALLLYEQIQSITRPVLDKAIRLLTLHIDTRFTMNPVVVFNPLGWPRSGEVVVPVPPGGSGEWMARDDEGRFYAVQKINDPAGGGEGLLFVAKDVPAFGYRVYSIIPAPQAVHNPCKAGPELLETPNFRIFFSGGASDIKQIRSKDLAWQLLSGPGNEIQVLEETGDSEGNLNFSGTTYKVGPFTRREVLEKGPVRVRIRIRNRLLGEHTTFVREISITDGIPWVSMAAYIEWNSSQRLVKAAFPVALEAQKAVYDGPFGPVEGPTDGRERFGRLWVDLSTGKRGIAILNANRGGYDVRPGLIRLSLLRSPTWPAHSEDGGNHTVLYALYPHLGDWREGKVWRRAWEFNVPLIAVPVDAHSGALPRRASFFSVEPDSVMLSTVKRAEDGSGLVLRLVEMEGAGVDAVIRSHWFLRSAFEADLLEHAGSELPSTGDTVKVHLEPHQVKTVVLKNWGFAPLK